MKEDHRLRCEYLVKKRCSHKDVVFLINRKMNRNEKTVFISRNFCRFCKYYEKVKDE